MFRLGLGKQYKTQLPIWVYVCTLSFFSPSWADPPIKYCLVWVLIPDSFFALWIAADSGIYLGAKFTLFFFNPLVPTFQPPFYGRDFDIKTEEFLAVGKRRNKWSPPGWKWRRDPKKIPILKNLLASFLWLPSWENWKIPMTNCIITTLSLIALPPYLCK